jgi:hypothetical protein
VFVVSWNGVILHFDGQSWSADESQIGRTLVEVWGSGPNDVFAADYEGAVLHYGGASWSVLDPIGCGGIWGSSGTDVYASSLFGRIYHYDGFAWSFVETPALAENPTYRIGEYNGVAVAGNLASAVWTFAEPNANGVPIAHQTLFDQFELGATGIDPASQDPQSAFPGLVLRQNSPNPFRSRTSIGFTLPASGRVTLRIYDASGRLVRELLDQRLSRDDHNIIWNGRDEHGRAAAAGIYWYRLSFGGETVAKRLILLH